MSNEKNNFTSTVESLFGGMDSFLSTKTVIGDAVNIGDTIILPLVDVSFGIGAGSYGEKNSAGGGIGGKMTPSAVLVITGGTTRLINIKNSAGFEKILDMVPDFVNKFTDKKKSSDKGQSRSEAGKALEETIIEASKVEED